MKLKEIAENHGLTPEGVDYALTQYQIVMCEITHGMMSKLSYDAKDIIKVAQERWCDTCDLKELESVKPAKFQTQTVGGWISAKDRLPVETHSIFWPWYGKKKWSKAMWREQSDKVLVTVAFKDGTKIVTTGETHDGVWNTDISRTLEPVVTHWQAMPEPPEE